jgi:hypothetical protein
VGFQGAIVRVLLQCFRDLRRLGRAKIYVVAISYADPPRPQRPRTRSVFFRSRGRAPRLWYTFDARNNMPRIGRVLMARGRDAIDVAIATTFGPNTLVSFKVWTDEMTN